MSKSLSTNLGEALGRAGRLYRRWKQQPASDDPLQLQDAQDYEGLIAALRRAATEVAGHEPLKWPWQRWLDRRRAARFLKNWAEEIEG